MRSKMAKSVRSRPSPWKLGLGLLFSAILSYVILIIVLPNVFPLIATVPFYFELAIGVPGAFFGSIVSSAFAYMLGDSAGRRRLSSEIYREVEIPLNQIDQVIENFIDERITPLDAGLALAELRKELLYRFPEGRDASKNEINGVFSEIEVRTADLQLSLYDVPHDAVEPADARLQVALRTLVNTWTTKRSRFREMLIRNLTYSDLLDAPEKILPQNDSGLRNRLESATRLEPELNEGHNLERNK